MPTITVPVSSDTLNAPLSHAPALAKSRPRDGRLDFWRALCLIDMVLVHLVYEGVNFGPLERILGEYTRFAAGGFVFVAGMGIGAIFLPRSLTAGGRWKVYPSLWRRAGYILCVHYAATLSFVSLEMIRGTRTSVPGLFALLRDILCFREGGDLLPLYVIMVAASPAVLELLRRRLWWVAAGASALLFAWGQQHVWLFSSPLHQNFPVILWQMIFVGGMLFGAVLPRYTALSKRIKFSLATASCLAAGVLWAANYRGDFGWTQPNLLLYFRKVPLSLGEALRYFSIVFAIIFSTDLLWDRLAESRLVALVNPVGRKSLAVYVTHVWVVGLLAMLAWHTSEWGAWQMLLAIPAVALLWIVARAMEWNAARQPAKRSRRLPARWASVPLGAIGGMLAFLVVGGIVPLQTNPATVNEAIVAPGWADQDMDINSSDIDLPAAPSFDSPDAADIIPV
jgi:hypothetical protein